MDTHVERAPTAPDVDQALASDRSQQRVTRAYGRIASIYDAYAFPMEWAGLCKRRERLVSRARGAVLEVGTGTGRSFRYYPSGVHVTATDAAPRMVERARQRATVAQLPIDVREADIQHLPFADGSFDSRRRPVCVLAPLPTRSAGLPSSGGS